MSKPRRKSPRAKELKVALAAAGMTLRQYAAELDYHADHIRRVAQGTAPASEHLREQIDAFIAKHLPRKEAA